MWAGGKGGALISCLLKTTQLRLVCLLPSDSSAFSLACFSRDCYYKRISLCTYNLFLFVMPKKFSFSIYFSSIQVSQGTSRHCEYHLPYLNYLRDIHIWRLLYWVSFWLRILHLGVLDKIQSSFRITFVKVYNSQRGLLSWITERLWLVSVWIFPQKRRLFFPSLLFFGEKAYRGQYKGTLSYGKCICIPRRMQLCSHRRKATRDAPNGKLGDETPLANFSTPIMPLDGKSAKKQ